MNATHQALQTTSSTVGVRVPAKLNLFLELLKRRDDGFHEIDTVMVPIDWCDHLRVCRSQRPGVRLQVDWLPSRVTSSRRLGLSASQLSVPTNHNNPVCRAISRFIEVFGVTGGFDCELLKSIPPGAGMGWASSDAAAALRCAAKLCGVPASSAEIFDIACSIGFSHVPELLDDRRVEFEHVIRLAEAALREAKRGGRDRAVGYLWARPVAVEELEGAGGNPGAAVRLGVLERREIDELTDLHQHRSPSA